MGLRSSKPRVQRRLTALTVGDEPMILTNQKSLEDFAHNEWQTINNEISHSKVKRFPYKKVLGCTLTEYITKHRLNGESKEFIYQLLRERMRYYLTEEGRNFVFPKVWISICARFGEQNSFTKRNK